MISASFVIPGDLASATGGYGYARRVLRGASAQGLDLRHIALPNGFPLPDAQTLGRAEEMLRALPSAPILIDGLCFGVLPKAILSTLERPLIALCHHPLAFETGISPAMKVHLHKSERTALRCADHVITTSHATAALLTRDYDVPAARITVAPPGTDPAPRAPGSGQTTCKILAVGSLTQRKRHDLLIAALAEHRDLDWSLRIVGPERDPAVAATLRARITALDLDDKITLTGALSLPALTAAYQGADLFALASEFEGFGMVFAEAMAHGLPVVGLQSDAVAEATAGAACLVSKAGFAPALAQLINNAQARAALSDRCWTSAQTFLRWPNTVAIISRVLQEASR